MDDPKKSLPLTQAPAAEDHAAKILREKVGDVRTLRRQPSVTETGTVIEGVLTADQKALEAKIIAALQTVFDPEIPLNIYDLGLIYKLALDSANAVKVEMTLTAPGCPVAGDIVLAVKRKIEAIPELPKVDVELVWDPPWTRDRLSEAARLDLGML